MFTICFNNIAIWFNLLQFLVVGNVRNKKIKNRISNTDFQEKPSYLDFFFCNLLFAIKTSMFYLGAYTHNVSAIVPSSFFRSLSSWNFEPNPLLSTLLFRKHFISVNSHQFYSLLFYLSIFSFTKQVYVAFQRSRTRIELTSVSEPDMF